MRCILTYGTFDTFHYGHVEILLRAASLGDRLYVGVSSEEFTLIKGKASQLSYEQRCRHVSALSCVYQVFAEDNWEQKADDIKRLNINVLVMGSDWDGKFDDLKTLVEVIYLPRTKDISSTRIRNLA